MQQVSEPPAPPTDTVAIQEPQLRQVLATRRRLLWWILATSIGLIATGSVVLVTAPADYDFGYFLIGLGLITAVVITTMAEKLRRMSALANKYHWKSARLSTQADRRLRVHLQPDDGESIEFTVSKRGVLGPFLPRCGNAWFISDGRRKGLLRMPGLAMPLYVKPSPATGTDYPPPHVQQLSGEPAGEDPVAKRFARLLRATAVNPVITCGTIIILSLSPPPQFLTTNTIALLVTSILLVTVFLGLAARWRTDRDNFALPQLLDAGAWTPIRAHLDEAGRLRLNGLTTARFTASMTSGEEVVFETQAASLDLVAYLEQNRTIYFAGAPLTSGTPVAVGVPGHPILAAARQVS